ncbi:energy-coupling factor transporter transmembrane component T family protein [Halorubrum rutilum]|uniref:Energy-coupling factor transporter transmembrane component T family protein n=1 Tax=Halorubrum rutilum TaxID=1364933 RepID=A0ABD6ALZ3_9EURY|nr:energy-coupling factor transporter transmembrane component T [Halorubrum rutilum]
MSAASSLYVHGDSVFHRLAPRAKIALAAGLFAVALVFDHPAFVGIPLVVAFGTLVALGGWSNFRRVRFIVVAVFVVGLVVWPLFTPAGGPIWLSTPVVELTRNEFLVALGRSTRFASFIVTGLLFVTVTSNEELVAGLRSLGVPFAFCFAVGTALRLFPTLLGATGTVRQAQEARGHDLSSGSPLQRIRNYIPLLIPVFMTAIRNVQTQAMALEARGFDTQAERTFYGRQSLAGSDWVAVGVGSLMLVGSVLARYVLGKGTV